MVALLPGSRHKEIVRILPVMLASAAEMSKSQPEMQFVIAVASGRNCVDVKNAIKAASEMPASALDH